LDFPNYENLRFSVIPACPAVHYIKPVSLTLAIC